MTLTDTGSRALICDIIGQATDQAKGDDTELAKSARDWLLSPESDWLMMPLNIDVTIREWVQQGCPTSGRAIRRDKKSNRDWHAYYENRREK
jgi:hypothetical protein